MVLIIFSNILNIDLIPLGIVEEKTDNYVIIDKLFYKEMIYADLNIGDVIIVRSRNKVEEKSLLKYIKSYQDEYEALISAMVDIIIDIPDVIKVAINVQI